MKFCVTVSETDPHGFFGTRYVVKALVGYFLINYSVSFLFHLLSEGWEAAEME